MNALSPRYTDTYVADGAPDGPVSRRQTANEAFDEEVAAAYEDQMACEMHLEAFDTEFRRLMRVSDEGEADYYDVSSIANLRAKLREVRKILER